MIVFAGIVPHPPILIPNIGKENLKVLEKTQKALDEMARDLYVAKPEVIILISPHGEVDDKKLTINQSDTLKANLGQFGDLVSEINFVGDTGFAYKMYEKFETQDFLKLSHENEVDHGVSVPLYYLTKPFEKIKVIPLVYSGLSYTDHYKIGQIISRFLKRENKRVAVIASGDLSHKLSKDAPAGFSAEGKKFDKKLKDLLEENDYSKVIKMDPMLAEEAGECGMRSISTMLGMVDGMNLNTEVLSYEAPFGVGYLVAELK